MEIERIVYCIVGQMRERLHRVDSNPTKEELKLFFSEIGSKAKIRTMIQKQLDILKAENTERSRQAIGRNKEIDSINLEDII